MKKIFENIKNNFKKNKVIYIVCFIFFLIMLYTHFNTFLANDDLSYSFLYRGNDRIKSLGQVLMHQLADYKEINARIFVHCIVQFLLIFGKNLWAILNPIMIIVTFILIIKLVKLQTSNFNKLVSILGIITCFLLMFNYKEYIYWVAGSINYVWVLTLLLLFVYLYFRYGFSKYKIVNILGIAILCAIHECTMVFTIVFIIGNFIYDWLKNKKINSNYFFYFIGFLGSLVLLLAPSSHIRMASDEMWNNLNLFQKLWTAIPVVSKNLFNLTDIKNVLPYIFIITILISLFNVKSKCSYFLMISIIMNMLLIYILKNDWFYFSLVLLLAIGEYYSFYKNKRIDLCIFSLAMYAVIYSNVLTPLYYAARPNYYFYIYIIFYTVYVINDKKIVVGGLKREYIANFLITIPCCLLLINEIYVYTIIGNCHRKRLEQIENYKHNNNEGTLILEEIPQKYNHYHMDINNPTKDWFTYRYFVNYYGLPQDVEIVYKQGEKI